MRCNKSSKQYLCIALVSFPNLLIVYNFKTKKADFEKY